MSVLSNHSQRVPTDRRHRSPEGAFVDFERSFLATADSRLDICDDDIDTLNGHLVKLKVVGREAIVRNDDIRVLLRRFNVALKRRLRLILVGLEQL